MFEVFIQGLCSSASVTQSVGTSSCACDSKRPGDRRRIQVSMRFRYLTAPDQLFMSPPIGHCPKSAFAGLYQGANWTIASTTLGSLPRFGLPPCQSHRSRIITDPFFTEGWLGALTFLLSSSKSSLIILRLDPHAYSPGRPRRYFYACQAKPLWHHSQEP